MRASLVLKTFAASLVLVAASASAGTKTTSTWTASDLQPRTYRKLAVLAKIEDEIAKRTLEDQVVKGLRDRGVEAVPAYEVFAPADLASDETVRAKANELGLDAGLVFTVTGEQTQVKSSPNVHASVGVPVRAGPFSVFVGTSVPLGGGSSSSKVVALKSEFYATDAEGPLWIATYSTDLKRGNERAAEAIASQALKQLKKAGLFE
jgi:hypothetical protein